ncbi:MAG: DUF3604 domain-containing protein [Desulfobacterales bacterium]
MQENSALLSGTPSKASRILAGLSVLLLLPFLPIVSVSAQDVYSPYADRSYPVNVYWGDTHVHTSFSADANQYGGNTVTPTIAYQFARGDRVQTKTGKPVRLRRPLDFLVIADHAGALGLAASIQNSDPALMETEAGKRLLDKFRAYQASPGDPTASWEFQTAMGTEGPKLGLGYKQSIWRTVTANAEAYNAPGIFTAFIGFEWSSSGRISGVFGNLHRVVIFKDDAAKANRIVPISARDSSNPEDLWRFLEGYQQMTGGEVLAIPHNGNLSNGEMFALTKFDGSALTTDWAMTRSRWEPLFEATQLKGDSETHPVLSPTDTFADFETWSSWAGAKADPNHACCKQLKSEGFVERKKAEYARSALKRGLDLQVKLGVNPFKFGMIGSTDSHTSLSTADNDNFWGQWVSKGPSPTRMAEQFSPGWGPPNWETGAAGYAGVWADENTRESLFAALKRREVYASTGPRITIRFFGGWGYTAEDAQRPDLARIGYRTGVPMGGDLTHAPTNTAPSFLIRAVKDPDGANLDRAQIIKGWRDQKGGLHEKIYDVFLSDGRKVRGNGTADPVGSTVNIQDASYTNTIGDPELAVTWKDPDFDPEEPAFYYVRVLEIPTPRWPAYDARFFGVKDIPDEVPMITQERAYTSPIWYTPDEG